MEKEALAARVRKRLARSSESVDISEVRGHEAGPVGARAWKAFLAGGLLLALLYVIMPYGLAASALYVVASLGAAVLVASAACFRPRLYFPTAWILLAGGLALTAAGHVVWFWFDIRGLEPFPSVADVFYLAAYPLYIGALWRLGGDDARGEGSLVDALFMGVAAGVLGWAFLIVPHFDAELGVTYKLVLAAYPAADLVLLPLILRLIFRYGVGISAYHFLAAGMAFYLLADILYAHGNLTGWYAPGGFTDGGWLVAYTLIVAAVWHPSAAVAPRSHSPRAGISHRRLALLAAAAVLVPAVSLVAAGTDVRIVWGAAIGSILLFLLVLLRMGGLINRIHLHSEKLEELARTDPLTGVANRRQMEEELRREVARAERTRAPLCLVFLDVDHFKRYNDTYGHTAGDELLRDIASAWSGVLRAPDLLSRYGGEEFVVVLPDTDGAQARQVADRLRARVPHGQTCSAGVACYQHGDSMDALVRRADEAMYMAKRSGRDQTVIADAGEGQ